MLPQGLLGIPPFFLLLPVAFWAAAEVMVAKARKESLDSRRLVVFQLGVAASALLGAKVFSVLERGGQWAGSEIELVAGWRHPGGIAAALIFVVALKPVLLQGIGYRRYGDLVAMVVPIGYVVLRLSCLMARCCTGQVCKPEFDSFCLSYGPGSEVWHRHVAEGVVGAGRRPAPPWFPSTCFFSSDRSAWDSPCLRSIADAASTARRSCGSSSCTKA